MSIDEKIVGEIGPGVVLLVGFRAGDEERMIPKAAKRVVNLRIFEDDERRMNLSLLDLDYSALVVSQFTLYADTQKGRRPSFAHAMAPDLAERYYEQFVSVLREYNIPVETGQFGAKMLVRIDNWGPVTLILDE